MLSLVSALDGSISIFLGGVVPVGRSQQHPSTSSRQGNRTPFQNLSDAYFRGKRVQVWLCSQLAFDCPSMHTYYCT